MTAIHCFGGAQERNKVGGMGRWHYGPVHFGHVRKTGNYILSFDWGQYTTYLSSAVTKHQVLFFNLYTDITLLVLDVSKR